MFLGGRYDCECGRRYGQASTLNRHKKYECGKNPEFECPICGIKHRHRFNLTRHLKSQHKEYDYTVYQK